jgi:crotonobetainyl-CoA:carnitine CoA-transferase CaiB-like acyl-CoA transferase
MATFRLYECGDGRWIQIACLQPAFFQRLLGAMGLPEVLRDARFEHAPRFSTNEDSEALIDILCARFREQASEVWLAALVAADVPCALVQDARELWHDPLFRESGIVVEDEDPRLGRLRRVGPVFVGEEGPTSPTPLPPLVAGDPPLDGLRVLELGGYQAGPMAGRLLADLGADVVKVEPLGGDPFRTAGNVFLALNHGKRSLAVDLKTSEGQVALRRLAETCAVVVHNLRPGVAERDGLGYAQLAAANPGLVYVHVSGFGTDASVAGRPAYDPLGAALAGVQRAQGGPEENPPSLVRTPVCDVGAGTAAAVAAIAGLLGRLRHGRGAREETSLLRIGAAAVAGTALWYEGRPAAPELDRDQYGAGPLCRLYPTADGWLFLVARPDDWPRLRSALGLANDQPPSALADVLVGRSMVDCLALVRRGHAAAIPVSFDFLRRFDTDAQVRAQGLAAEVVHPAYGRVTLVGPAIRFSVTPSRVGPPAPALGEHTESLLAEVGYDEAQRLALHERTVVKWSADWPVAEGSAAHS